MEDRAMAIPALKYATGPGGWAAGMRWLDPGVVIDTSKPEWAWATAPPPDAVPLDQFTYDFMVSQGVVGMSYAYHRVAVGPGVKGINPRAAAPSWQALLEGSTDPSQPARFVEAIEAGAPAWVVEQGRAFDAKTKMSGTANERHRMLGLTGPR
jgi:hypothetical protein